ncbi:hypothetical protein SALBM135S_07150 [Streptomyces alboniger]
MRFEASEARVFVEALQPGEESVNDKSAQYEIEGLTGDQADNTYGIAEKIDMEKQDFQGIKAAYEFDPRAEKYLPVDPMKKARGIRPWSDLRTARCSPSPGSTTSA